MPQHKIRFKLKSGKYVTGLLDILSGIPEMTRTMGVDNIGEFLNEITDKSDGVVDKTTLYSLIDKTLSDPKYKYIIAVYGVKIY